MSSLSREEILHVARLARLEFSPAEIDRFSAQLSGILTYVEQLGELDVSGVEPTSHALPLKNVLREDEVRPSLSPDEVLANAPERIGDCYKVPAVIGGGGSSA